MRKFTVIVFALLSMAGCLVVMALIIFSIIASTQALARACGGALYYAVATGLMLVGGGVLLLLCLSCLLGACTPNFWRALLKDDDTEDSLR